MQEGDSAPNFQLKSNDGSTINLESFKNKKNVVLCFYPKNHLFACPSKKVYKMAQSVVSAYSDIVSEDTVLFAISIDTIDSQKKFVEEYKIPYLHLFGQQGLPCGGGATPENLGYTSFEPCVYRHKIEKNEIEKRN